MVTLFKQYNPLNVFLFIAVSLYVVEVFRFLNSSIVHLAPEHDSRSAQLHSDC